MANLGGFLGALAGIAVDPILIICGVVLGLIAAATRRFWLTWIVAAPVVQALMTAIIHPMRVAAGLSSSWIEDYLNTIVFRAIDLLVIMAAFYGLAKLVSSLRKQPSGQAQNGDSIAENESRTVS